MQENIYQIAGHIVGIASLHDDVQKLCNGYCSEAAPEFWVRMTEEDIVAERERANRTDRNEGRIPQNYPDGYLETLAVYRKLTEQLLEYGIFLMHGSVVAVDGKGYLFTAKSGTGKSTHTRLWMQLFGDRAMMINDDKPLIEVHESGVLVYGTPWDGKHHRSTNCCVPLKAICKIDRGEKNKVTPIEKKEMYPVLLQQIYRPATQAGVVKTLELIEKMTHQVKLYQLHCNMQPEAASVAYEGMQ